MSKLEEVLLHMIVRAPLWFLSCAARVPGLGVEGSRLEFIDVG